MKYFIFKTAVAAYIFLSSALIAQISNYKQSNVLRRESIQKYLAKDYDGFLTSNQKAMALRKNHPSLIYNSAIGYALTNRPDSAYSYLNRLAEMKLYFPAENDSDFVSLWTADRFKEITNRINETKMPHGNSEFLFSLPDKDLLTESVAYNPNTETYYVGSVHKRKIFSVTKEGIAKVFAESGKVKFGGVLGMKVDSKNNLLWACTGYFPQIQNYDESDNGLSEVLKIDLTTHNILMKYTLPDGNHSFGDLVIDNKSNVYISDSRDNNIYIINEGSGKIEPYLISDYFASLQGVDFSDDGSYLFAADYAMGLFKINVNTKEVSIINIPDNLTDLGLDGLYFYNESLIGIQNGVNPQRVIRMYLDKEYNKVVSWEVIEANNKYFFEPTLGVLNGNEFYYIANSQWPNFKEDGSVAPEEKLSNPVILKTILE